MLVLPIITSAQLQNTDFEVWQNDPIGESFHNKPVGWMMSDGWVTNEANMFYYPPETDSQNGDYALKLGVWYNYTKDAARQYAPINSRPTALTGYYKYTNNQISGNGNEVDDIAQVSIALTKWDETLSKSDTIGYGKIDLNASLNYSSFSCPVVYTSNVIPDSVTVYLDCSMVKRQGLTGNYISMNATCSYFTVDNLNLEENTAGNKDFMTANNIKIYPNPANDKVGITNFSGDVEVYDITGKLILSKQNIERNNPIDVLQLQKGIYTIKLTQGNNVQYSKLIRD